jgi:23S rRNA pseudouridine1911/1915/1917 synthase
MKDKRVELWPENSGERLDKALAELVPELSRSQWQRLIREGHVVVDGLPAKASQRLGGSEKIEAFIPEPAESELVAEAVPLDIRYEDGDLVVINKPAGMVVHPGPGHFAGTLVNALLAHCPDLPGIGDTKRPGIVHRLDKDTSGLIVAAKNDRALRQLQAQFKQRTIIKRYIALVDGRVEPSAALIDAPIGRDPERRKMMSVIHSSSPRAKSAHTRDAQTQYRALHIYEQYSLLECTPLTGRTHQLRVHLAYIGHPIVGDRVYGRRKQRISLSRHFLHAKELTFRRPSDGAVLTFSAVLPPELQTIIEGLAG